MKKSLRIHLALFLICFTYYNNIEAQTDLNISTNYQGYSRSFRVHIPPGYSPNQPIPLVFVYHGGGISNSLEIKNRTRFHLLGDTANFITVYPQALMGSWADSRGTLADKTGIDDVGFTSFIIDTLSSLYNIDNSRIYAAGMSTGGVFCQRLALQSNSRIAAFASVGSSLYTALLQYFPPSRKIPALYMIGTSDRFNPYYGGIGLSTFYSINTDSTIASWVSFDNCFPIPTIYEFPDINTADNSTVTKFTYYPCQSCSEVNLYRINNGGHTWPGGLNNNPPLGVANHDINASHEIWLFFKRHQLGCPGDAAGSNLITLIEQLGLSHGLENSLMVKIENAMASCANGNENAAINKLNSFINLVNAKRGKDLTNAEANQLIAFAQDLINSIENGTADCGSGMLKTIVQHAAPSIQKYLMKVEGSETDKNIQFSSMKEEIRNKDYFILNSFPNPADKEINISYNSPHYFTSEIISVIGETVLRNRDQKTINISKLQNGIYFLKVTDTNNIVTKRINIQH